LNLSLPLKNRSAQADNLRAQFEEQQLQTACKTAAIKIQVEVRQAIIGLIQGKGQVEAAHQAVRLAKKHWMRGLHLGFALNQSDDGLSNFHLDLIAAVLQGGLQLLFLELRPKIVGLC